MTHFAGYARILCAIMLPLLAAGLAGCGGRINPFSKQARLEQQVHSAPPPPLEVVAVKGLPPHTANRLAAYLGEEAAARGIPPARPQAVAGKRLRIEGALSAGPVSRGTAVAYVWDVRAGSGGRHHHRISGTGTFGERTPGALGDAGLRRIAAATAERLAQWLVKRGYALGEQVIPPPASVLAHAPEPEPAPERRPRAAAAPRPAPAATASVQQPKAGLSIAVAPVTGAGSGGNRELAEALRRALAGEGAHVDGSPAGGAHTVEGAVRIAEARNRRQQVEIDWKLFGPDRRALGTVSQRNAVPAGSLDDGWGATADAAAGAAAQGLMALWRSRR